MRRVQRVHIQNNKRQNVETIKHRKQNFDKTKRRQEKNFDYNKTSTTTKRRKIHFGE
jgi:hypothetical protein